MIVFAAMAIDLPKMSVTGMESLDESTPSRLLFFMRHICGLFACRNLRVIINDTPTGNTCASVAGQWY